MPDTHSPKTPAWPPKSAPRLFVPAPLSAGTAIAIEGQQAHYLARVMRVSEGDAVVLCDDATGEWAASVASAGKRDVVLIPESLLRPREDVPDFTLCAALLKKDMPLIINRFGGWLDFPEYFFFWCYHGQNAVFNTMSYQNATMDKVITNARFAESKPLYDSMVKEMVQIAYDEVPRVPIFQPTMDVAMRSNVQGYMYWFHLQPDYRQLSKA